MRTNQPGGRVSVCAALFTSTCMRGKADSSDAQKASTRTSHVGGAKSSKKESHRGSHAGGRESHKGSHKASARHLENSLSTRKLTSEIKPIFDFERVCFAK